MTNLVLKLSSLSPKAPLHRKFRSGTERQMVRLALLRQGTEIKKTLQLASKTWKNEKPIWSVKVKTGGGNAEVEVFLDDLSYIGNKKFMWLDEGTGGRWSVVSSNWESKTEVGNIASGPGRGKVKLRGRRVMEALNIPMQNGIVERDFIGMATEEHEGEFVQELGEILDLIAEMDTHGGFG